LQLTVVPQAQTSGARFEPAEVEASDFALNFANVRNTTFDR